MSNQDLKLAVEFTATDKGLSGKINLTKEELEKLNKAQRDGVKSSDTGAAANQRQERSLFKLKAGFAAVVTGIAALTLKTISVTRETERMTAQLITATGSIDAGGLAFERLNTFAKQTPYTLQQSVESFKTLKNLGLDPSERAMKSYGNTAAAMGKDMTQMIEAVADATTGEFERLKEFGIKSRQEGENVTFTFRGVETTIKKSSENIQQYLLGIGETHFADAMSNQMDTIDGKLSNLEQTVNDFFRVLGDDNAAMDAFRDSIDWVTEAIDNATGALKFFKANLKADEIADNAAGIADAVRDIELATLGLAQVQGSAATGAIDSYNEQLATAQTRLKDLGAEYAKLHPAAVKLNKDNAAEIKNSKALDSAYTKNTQSLKKLKDTKKDLIDLNPCKAIRQELSCMDQLIANYVPLAAAVNEHNQQMNELNLIYSNGRISAEQYTAAIKKIDEGFNKPTAAAKDHAKVIKKEVPQAYKDLATGTRDVFKDLFLGIKDNNDDVLDSMLDSFADYLIEMAATAAANTIAIPIMQQVGGYMGLSPNAINQTTSQLGGFQMPFGGSSMMGGGSLLPNGFSLSNFGGSASGVGAYNAATGSYTSGQFAGYVDPNVALGNTGMQTSISSGITSGLGAFFGGYAGAQLTGSPIGGMAVGAGGTALMGGLGAMGAGGAGFMAGAGGALAAMGPVGWAALAIGALAGGGMFDGDSDITPDLNLSYWSGNGNKSNAKKHVNSPNGMVPVAFDEDAAFGVQGRFGSTYVSTQHDAFASSKESKEFADNIKAKMDGLDDLIYYSLGSALSEEVVSAMQVIASGEIKYEDMSSESGSAIENMFQVLYKNIFKSIGDVVNADYEEIFTGFLKSSGDISVGVSAFAGAKSIIDSGSERSIKNITNTMHIFVDSIDDLDEQLKELSAVTQLLTLESVNDDFATFMSDVNESMQAELSKGMSAEVNAQLSASIASAESKLASLNSEFAAGNYRLSFNGATDVDGYTHYRQYNPQKDELEQQIAAVKTEIKSLNAGFESFVNPLKYSAQEILVLGNNLLSVNSILDNTNQSVYDLSLAGAELAAQLVAGAGGIDALNQKSSYYYYQNFYSETERTQNVLDASRQTIADFNDAFDTSVLDKTSLRNTMESLDVTTESGIELYNALLNLAPTVNTSAQALQFLSDQQKASALAAQRLADQQKSDILAAQRLADQQKSDTLAAQRLADQKRKDDALAAQQLADEQKAFNNTINSLYSALKGESDVNTIVREITDMQQELGLLGDHTRFTTDSFADFIKTLDGTDAATRDTLPNIEKLGDALISLKNITKNLQATIDSNINDLYGSNARLDSLRSQRDTQIRINNAAKDAYRSDLARYQAAIQANETIKSMLDSLKISDLNNQSPMEKLIAAQGLFSNSVASGDAQDATQYGREYLSIAQKYYASTDDYSAIFTDVTAMLDGMSTDPGNSPTTPGDSSLSSIDRQISVLERQITASNRIADRQLTAESLVESMLNLGIATDQTLEDIAADNNITMGQLNRDLNNGNAGLANYLIEYMTKNTLTVQKLSDLTGTDNDIINSSLRKIGWSNDDIEIWNKKAWEENSAGNTLLNSIDQSLVKANRYTYEENLTDGYGNQYSDNKLLHYIADGMGIGFSRWYLDDISRYTLSSANTLKAIANNSGVKGYAEGTGYVQGDQVAQIHNAEMVIDAQTAAQLRKYGIAAGTGQTVVQNNADIIKELRELKAELKSIKSVNQTGFKESTKESKRNADIQDELLNRERVS